MDVRFSSRKIDNEHLRIMKSLQKYDVEPTGDKRIDKVLLEDIKEAEIKGCQKEFEYSPKETLEIDLERQRLEEERRGAEMIAWQNRVFLGI